MLNTNTCIDTCKRLFVLLLFLWYFFPNISVGDDACSTKPTTDKGE